jgi:hypothetical protein
LIPLKTILTPDKEFFYYHTGKTMKEERFLETCGCHLPIVSGSSGI